MIVEIGHFALVLALAAALAQTVEPPWGARAGADGLMGVGRERRAADQPFLHAARHRSLKQLAQKVALAKAAVAVLREGRMVGSFVEPQAAEPMVGQI
jgi:cytochrome c biogenesis factor